MSIENQLAVMKEYAISAEEYFFLQLLFLAQPEEDKGEYLYTYLTELCNKVPREMLLKFQDNGIITKSYHVPNKGEEFRPDAVIFNKNFLNRYFKYSGLLGEELFMNYPNFIQIRGTTYSLKNIAKKYNSLEDFYFAYAKAIGHKPDKHKEVMSLLDWAKENSLINTNICEFVISRKWLEIAEIKASGYSGNDLNIDELI